MDRELKTALVRNATERACHFFQKNESSPVFPTTSSIRSLFGFSEALPGTSTDPAEVLAQLDDLGSPATVRYESGRYFGFVMGSSEPVATAASILSTAWDQNVGLPVMSPVGAHLDAITARWICELLGLPGDATASFCSGATIANLTCVLAARDALLARAGWDVREKGLFGAPPLQVVASAEIHVSVLKALQHAGIGRNAITMVDTDDHGRIQADALPETGAMTLALVQAGNVNTGHSDPFAEIIPRIHANGGWVHVDGAFGLWAAASPRRAHHVEGVQRADSWATDSHKWLNAPYDAGIAICAREEDLRRAMTTDAAYLATGSKRALMHLGLQLSQRARAIETWSIIASKGRSGIAAMIDNTCDLAQRMAEGLARGGAELLAPVGLNQMLVSFGPDTHRVIEAVQADGTCWAGGTVWKGQSAMRLSLSDTTITEAVIDESVATILRAWRSLEKETAPPLSRSRT
ncbi:MAG: aminotransferase class V-fold PLP-dependent enzyme [Verrucomicrobiota bacterium]